MVSQHAALRRRQLQSSTPPNKQLSEILVTDVSKNRMSVYLMQVDVTCLCCCWPQFTIVNTSWASGPVQTRPDHLCPIRTQRGVLFCSVPPVFSEDVRQKPAGPLATKPQLQSHNMSDFCIFVLYFHKLFKIIHEFHVFEGDRETTPVNSCMLGGVVFSVCSDIRVINICLSGSDACFLIIPLPRWCKKNFGITRGENRIPLHRFWICLALKLFISADPTDHSVRFNRHLWCFWDVKQLVLIRNTTTGWFISHIYIWPAVTLVIVTAAKEWRRSELFHHV